MLTLEEREFRAKLLARLNKLIDVEETLIEKIDELNKNLTRNQ